MSGKQLTLAAALCSLAVALLHVFILLEGPWAYRYFGAGERMARLAEQGSWIPALLTAAIAALFALFAACYLSAAGWLPRPPLLRTGLVAIAALYTLRGAGAFLASWMGMRTPVFACAFWASFLSLAIGLLHCAAAWRFMRAERALRRRG